MGVFSEHSVATTADQYKVVYDLSIGAIFSDHERPSCQVLIDWLIDWLTVTPILDIEYGINGTR